MEIKMPKLGESVHEGTIEQWLVQEGDRVEEYDPLCEVITDKVTAEVPSSYAGTIKKIIAAAGDTVEVGSIICEMEVQGDTDETTENVAPEADATTTEQTNVQPAPPSTENQSKNNGRFSPVVFRLASENNIDLSTVTGTGFEAVSLKKILNVRLNKALLHQKKMLYLKRQ